MKLHPGIALGVNVAFIIIVVSFPIRIVFPLFVFLLYPIYLAGLVDVNWKRLLKRFVIGATFILSIAISQVFLVKSTCIIFNYSINCGWIIAISLLLRYVLTAGTTLILIEALSYSELACGLRFFSLPITLVNTFLIILRFLELIEQQAKELNKAKQLRIIKKQIDLKLFKGMLLSLFLRCIERGKQVGWAWTSRGLDKGFPYKKFKVGLMQSVISIIGLSIAVLVRLFYIL